MKQLFLHKGVVHTYNVPEPLCGPNDVLVKVHYSFISSGTESATVSASGISLAKKFTHNLHSNTQKLITTLKDHGFTSTLLLLKEKAGQKLPLGYSCSGQVIDKGKNVTRFQCGDYVACAGAGYANHAHVVAVPEMLVTRLKNATSLRQASLTTLGAIALQGVRRADLALGENVCVIGLGILGQLTVGLAHSSGCTVFGIDIRQERLERAKKMGVTKTFNAQETDVIKEMHYATGGFGADVTIIVAAAATGDIINQAMQITRKKGKVILVGDVKIDFARDPFYSKEIDFLISCSYGPGRYDNNYERGGLDYPYAYVRWTEQRNMAFFTQMIENNILDVSPLIDHEFTITDASKAYNELKNSANLGIVLVYPAEEIRRPLPETILFKKNLEKIAVACIGAGGFAKTKLLPMIAQRNDVLIHTIVDIDPAITLNIGSLYNAHTTTNNYTTMLADPTIDTIIIATPHYLHTQQTIDSLTAGKAVFVEKPAAVSFHQLDQLKKFLSLNTHQVFCVDFNRPFAPFIQKINQSTIKRSSPMLLTYRMNVGYLDPAHWIQSKANGGRIIGEACHIFDLFLFLTQSTPRSVGVQVIRPQSDTFLSTDNVIATIHLNDGSVCCLIYTSQGDTTAGKEFMEIHCDGKTVQMNDFITLTGYGLPKSFTEKTRSQDKGHQVLLNRFFDAVKNGTTGPVPLDRILLATELSLIVDDLARKGGGYIELTTPNYLNFTNTSSNASVS